MSEGYRIEWNNYITQTQGDYSYLIGAEDAFEHTMLSAGEQVAFCRLDKVAYHLDTWQFLRSQNQGRCCVCGRKGTIQIISLPGAQPSLPTSNISAIPTQQSDQIIKLDQIPEYIGRAAVVQDFVHEVYQTRSTGAFYIRFERRGHGDPPFQGFKAVIRPRYIKAWSSTGIWPGLYENQIIRVRGVIQKHPVWGTEILINSPHLVVTVQGSTGS